MCSPQKYGPGGRFAPTSLTSRVLFPGITWNDSRCAGVCFHPSSLIPHPSRRTVMLRSITTFLLAVSATLACAQEVTLTRLADCGTGGPRAVNERFSDTYAYGDLKVAFVFSCYLVKHGDDYMMWDTGQAMSAAADVAPKVSVVDQLAKLNVTPAQIKYVGISHYHGDHTGQVDSFPGATVLIGKGDWDAVSSPKPGPGVNFKPFAHWISGGGKVEALPGDKDVFGDGTVVILNTPGHT